MEKTERRVEREGEVARLRSRRVVLGEITNVTGRDRRKPCVVKRVTAAHVKTNRRTVEPPRPIIKANRELIHKNHPTMCKRKDTTIESMQVDNEEDVIEDALTNVRHKIGKSCNLSDVYQEKAKSTSNCMPYSNPEKTVTQQGPKKLSREELTQRIMSSDQLNQYDQEIYEYLLVLERQQALSSDHLKDRKITGKMRHVVVDWLFEVQNHFKLCQESIELTLAILDKCLVIDPTIDQENVQLVCLAAMFIATKYQEIFLLELSDLRYVCDYSFKECEILNMERRVLKMLDFKLNFVLRTNFTGIYMRSLPTSITVEGLVRYYVDLSLAEYGLASVEPSKVACACLYIALSVLDATSHNCVTNVSTYSLLEVRTIIVMIISRAISVTGVDRGGIYNKHFKDVRSSGLRDIVRSEKYSETLKNICTALQ